MTISRAQQQKQISSSPAKRKAKKPTKKPNKRKK
tara:strand:+ start:153 stop:254 length:102 start_codon:yes stop_codon:yes gene_type:complete